MLHACVVAWTIKLLSAESQEELSEAAAVN